MFTCNTCNLEFPGASDQRTHMKSDWHRYNLKRRVAQLPPLDEDFFNSKVAALTLEESDEAPGKKKGEKQVTKKEQRRKEKEALQEQKRQLLEQARKSMMAKINSGEISPEELAKIKSQQAETAAEEPSESANAEANQTEQSEPVELTPEQQEEKLIQEKLAQKIEIKPTTCLFCHPKENKNFDTVEENIEHMFKSHGLYIPEPKYLEDKAGLISYLGEKISFGFCIACNYQGKNAEAAREHMRTKRHRRIPYETEDEKLEISEFYDFSSTYDDYEPVKVVAEGEQEEGEDWEDVEEESGEEGSEDEEYVPPVRDAIYQDGNELILPSGTVLGHRSMARYYRQNLPPDRVLSEGQGTVIAAETRHMLTLKDRQELASKKRAWGKQKKREDVNDRRAQKFINNQPHFRDQLLQ